MLAVLYLVFNEGYSATTGDALVRRDLCAEAIRLARLLAALLPDAARRAPSWRSFSCSRTPAGRRGPGRPGSSSCSRTRTGRAGTPRRSPRAWRWWRTASAALPAGEMPGPYLLQAAIAACHGRSATAAATPWAEIAALYGVLAVVAPGPVVELNRAVAVAMADGPTAGLVLVEALGADGALADYHLFHATRADLLRRVGRRPAAAAAYERALGLATNDAERAFLARRLGEVSATG